MENRKSKKVKNSTKILANETAARHKDDEERHEAAILAHMQARKWAKGKAKWPQPVGHDCSGTAYYHKPDMSSAYCKALYGPRAQLLSYKKESAKYKKHSKKRQPLDGKIPIGGGDGPN